MTVFFGRDYVTTINDLVFTPSGGQFGPDATGFDYSAFFGVGEDELVGDTFDVGGPVIMDIPFVGETEVFRGRLFGELGVQFGLQVSSTLDPGSVDAILPYQTVVAFPDIDPAVLAEGEIIDLFFQNEFRPGDDIDSGFTTEFPSFTFDIGIVTELVTRLAAEVGALGNNTTITLLDFSVPETLIPILSIDTNRTITAEDVADDPTLVEGDFNPVELFGDTTPELIDNAGLDPAYNDAGELAGIGIPLNTFVSGPDAPDPEPVDASPEGDETPDTDPGFDLGSIDLGSIEIFVPNINTVSSFVDADGVFVTDPSRKAIYNRDSGGNLTGIDRVDDLDTDGENLNEGNRDDLVRLTLDLDGLITYATGGTFPPLELGPIDILDGSFGPINLDASFSYNLLDVELEAALPLEQEFTLTPKLLTQFRFFEANDDGTKGAEKTVDVRMNQKVLNFDETGTFRDAALEARLQQLAASNPIFGQDISLFVDFNDGIPGAFTGQTASLGGRMIISRDGGATFEELVTGVSEPIAFSAPELGQEQTGDLTIDDQTVLGYRLFIGSGSAEVQEDYVIAFDKSDSVYVETVRETNAAISQTPFLEDLNTLNLVYDADDTFVEVVTRAAPTITNRTGLEFDLALLLSGLEASATFDASVDIGPITVGTGIDFDLGPLFDEEFELLNLDIVDLFNGSFEIEQEQTQSFVLGGPAPASDFGDAIVGTDGNDTLDGTAGDDEIIALGGEDLIDAGDGDDTVVLGSGADTAYGGDAFDTIDLSDLEGSVVSSPRTFAFAERTVTRVNAGERAGLSFRDIKVPNSEDAQVFSYDPVTSRHVFSDFEAAVFSDLADDVVISNAGLNVTDFDLGAGNDFVASSNAPDGLTIDAGAGDDYVDLGLSAGAHVSVDGAAGHDYLVTRESFDLATGLTAAGGTFRNFESVQDVSADASVLGGTEDANTIGGGSGDDTLMGRGGNDLLVGGADNDVLIGGAGADSMEGGSGLDTADYSGAATSVFIDLDFGGVGRGFRGEAQGDTFSSVENITGSDFDDIIIGNNADNTLNGGDGDDRLQSQNGGDLLLGGDGDDLLNRGSAVTLGGNIANVYDGGEGFDVVAVDVFDRFTQTGSTTGTATFTYRTGTQPFDGVSTEDRNVTIDYRYVRSAHVELALDETGSGDIRYVEDDASDRLFATGLSGTARYSSRNEPTIIPLPPFVIPDLTFDVRSSSYDYNIPAKRYASIIDDGISFSRVSSDDYNDVNGSGRVTDIGSPPDVRGGEFATEQVMNVEGLIGSNGNDRLSGNSHDNAFFGNGGSDLLRGGGGNDRLGFGEAQALTDVFSFPGSNGSGAPDVDSRIFLDLEDRLARMNPEGVEAEIPGVFPQNDWTPVGKIQINASGATQDIGSFLWGQEGDDTLDMRFDRGISFFPDLSTNYAEVDLNIASGSAPINFFTGEQIQYGRAEWYDAAGDRQSFATTFGVENVIGSTQADSITGDRNDNSIEGGDGADILDGDAGYDTASWSLANEGVVLNFRADGGVFVLDNARETITGAGDATGDHATGFERFVASDHADVAILEGAASTVTSEFPVTFDYITTSGPAFVTLTATETITYDSLDADSLDIGTTLEMGAGDDAVILEGLGAHDVTLGDGDDTALLRNIGHTIAGGAGDDEITIQAHDRISLRDVAAEDRVTIVDGGADEDTVVFSGGDYLALEITDAGVTVTERVVPPFSQTQFQYVDPQFGVRFENLTDEPAYIAERAAANAVATYELTDVEFVEIDGQRIRIDNPDPVVDADKTITMAEDAIDPYDLGLRIPQTDVDGGATFEIIDVPRTALLQTPGGVVLVAGDMVPAGDMAALRIVPLQGFDPKDETLTYLRTGDAPEDALSRQLPDTVRGVALDITSHLVEQTVEIATPVAPEPTVALVRLNPGLDVGDLPLAETLDYAEVGAVADMPTGDFTFEMLFRSFGELDPDGPDQVFASYATGSNDNAFLLYGYKDGRGLEVSFNGRRLETGIRVDSLFDREMHRISVRVDPEADVIEVLIDGVLQFSRVSSISGGLEANGTLIIGQEQDSPGGGFNANQTLSGEIGDIRIWSSLRTDAEIQANAFRELADPSGAPDLAANFRADTGNQGVMVNAVGTDHLAIRNAPDVIDAVLPGLPDVTVIGTVRVNVPSVNDEAIQVGGFAMPTGPMTIETIIQFHDDFEANDGRQHFISYAVDDNASNNNSFNELLVFADQNTANPVLGLVVNNSQTILTDVPSTALMDGDAHRFSLVFDPVADLIEIYIDGQQVYSQTHAIAPIATGGYLNFGQDQDGLGTGFQDNQQAEAAYGDIRIWSAALDAATIAANAFAPLADPASEATLVANWQVDTSDIATVPDVLGGTALTQVATPHFSAAVFPNAAEDEAPTEPEVTTITQVVDQQGDPVTIRVESVPINGTVFYIGPDPTADASDHGFIFGLEVEIPVSVGDVLTPEQLESLFFRADENFSGDPGDFSYSVTDDVSFRQLSATQSADVDNRTDGADNDGSATQVISFDITPINDAPEIGNVLFPISPGAEFESTVRVSDADGDELVVTLTTAATFGTVVVNADGSFTYQQNAAIDFAGAAFIEDVFEVTATEVGAGSAVSSIDPTTSGPQRQVIRIINPDLQDDIVFDPEDSRFFDDEGNPVNIGGLATDDVIIGHAGQDGLFGFGGHDSIAGREEADFLSGGVGNDTLMGEAGNDTLDGGEGADLLDGGEGIDTADYSSEQSGVTAILSSTGSSGAALGDTITGIENIRGTDFSDFLTGDGVANTLMGGEANDTLNGRGGDDWLSGEADNDRLLGGSGNDTLEGGGGNDLLQGQVGEDVLMFGEDDGHDTAFGFELGLDKLDFSALGLRFVDLAVIEAAGSSRIEYDGGTGMASVNLQGINPTQITSEVMMDPTGAGGTALIEGDAGGNNLAGGADGEDLVGGAGNDTLNARGGDDTMVGGLGDDQYFVEQAGDVVIEQANQGRDMVRSAVSFTLGANIEVGTTRNNSVVIDITGNELDNELNGNDQSNLLSDDLGRDRLRGRGGDDTLNGGADADVLEGGSGADVFVFEADSGIDLITDFEVGVDLIDVTALGLSYADMRIQDGPLGAQVFLDLTPGSVDLITLNNVSASELLLDSFITAFGDNQPPIVGTPGDDNLSGSQIDDELQGLGGNDQVNGQLGADTMIGGPGDDTYTIDNPGDVVIEHPGEGTDRVISELDVVLPDNVENGNAAFGTGAAGASVPINVTGNAGENLLNGNDAANMLSGLAGADNLQGKGGQDVINGGADNDILRGGTDADRFVFDIGDGSDLIVDFEAGLDVIDLSATGLDYNDLTIQSVGANATVAYGADIISLLNVTDAQLDATQFEFV